MWGKILGSVAGFALGGGPFGAVLGAALGHAAEQGGFSGMGSLGSVFGGGTGNGGGSGLASARVASLFGRREEVFALCVVVLSAKLAKCDGPVNRAEIDAFKQTFRSPPESARDIGRLFDSARDSATGFEHYAAELGDSHMDAPGMLEDVLKGLFQIARADKPLTQPEVRFLQTVWEKFHLDEGAWRRAMAAPQPGFGGGSRAGAARGSGSGAGGPGAGGQRSSSVPPRFRPEDDPYVIIGAKRGDGDDELRARWKKLVRENHPDTLASRGASADRVARASEKVARINAAWDSIKRERGL